VQFLVNLTQAGTATRLERRAVRALADADLRSEALDAVLALARSHPHPVLRREAIEALVELDERSTVGALMRLAATDPDSLVQRTAVAALGEVRPRAVAIDSLAHVVLTHQRSIVRQTALRQIGDFDRVQKADIVLAELSRASTDPDVRARAATMLRRD
jgi:HEAT repeat protein